MTDISVRYIVDDVDAAVDFYTSKSAVRGRDATQRRDSRCSVAVICDCC